MSCLTLRATVAERAAHGRPGFAARLLLLTMALAGAESGPASADWDPGDPFKMHFPQLPDPNGWDILFVGPLNEVADDWQCTETGPVTDLHFWYSIQGDGAAAISSVTANIYGNNPSGPFSTPASLLWSGTFSGQQLVTRLYGSGTQGFADPKLGPIGWVRPDHVNYYQLNITGIENAFLQEQGQVYWLGLNVATTGTAAVGWKTSVNPFLDDAVYRGPGLQWEELIAPEGGSQHMAFVVTPEPGGVAVAATGIAGAVGLVLRRRSGRRAAADGRTDDRGRPAEDRECDGPVAAT